MFFKSGGNWYLSQNGKVSPNASFSEQYGLIPDVYFLAGLDYPLVDKTLSKIFQDSLEVGYRKTEINKKKEYAVFEAMYNFPKYKMMVTIGSQSVYESDATRLFYCKETPKAVLKRMIDALNKCHLNTDVDATGYLEMMSSSSHGIEFTEFKINKPKLNLEDVYPSDFLPIHKRIASRLNQKSSKGLVILHGEPGTGKTTYIRYLISQIKKHKIFLSPQMTHIISRPDFVKTLEKRSDSVLIIEDAENILMAREGGGSDAVSNLLNLSDGLLADCFNIQVICTFNTQLENIDSALLRKGRLIARYEFPKLSQARAKAIANQLGKEIEEPEEESSLADLFDPEGAINVETTRKRMIGFQFAQSDDNDYDLPF